MNTGHDVFSVNHITFPATVNKTPKKRMEKLFKLEAFLKKKLSTLKGYGTFFRAFLLVPAGR